jgi:hypothetical protein
MHLGGERDERYERERLPWTDASVCTWEERERDERSERARLPCTDASACTWEERER